MEQGVRKTRGKGKEGRKEGEDKGVGEGKNRGPKGAVVLRAPTHLNTALT